MGSRVVVINLFNHAIYNNVIWCTFVQKLGGKGSELKLNILSLLLIQKGILIALTWLLWNTFLE